MNPTLVLLRFIFLIFIIDFLFNNVIAIINAAEDISPGTDKLNALKSLRPSIDIKLYYKKN